MPQWQRGNEVLIKKQRHTETSNVVCKSAYITKQFIPEKNPRNSLLFTAENCRSNVLNKEY